MKIKSNMNAIVAFIPIILVLIVCGVQFNIASSDSKTLPFSVSSTSEDGFTTYKGCGVEMGYFYKEGSPAHTEKIELQYNSRAGNIKDTWNGRMTWTDFEMYQSALIQVNGAIIEQDKSDKSLQGIYTFTNEEVLEVTQEQPLEPTKTFPMEAPSNSEKEPIHNEFEDGGYITIYDNGYVEQLTYEEVDATEPIEFKSYYRINFPTLILIMVIFEVIVVGTYILVVTLYYKKKYHTAEDTNTDEETVGNKEETKGEEAKA